MKIFDRIVLSFYWLALVSSILLAVAGFVAPLRQWIEDHSPIQSDPSAIVALFVTLGGCWVIDLNMREYQLKPLPGWMFKLVVWWVMSCVVIMFAFQIKNIFPEIKRFVYIAFLIGFVAGEFARPKGLPPQQRFKF